MGVSNGTRQEIMFIESIGVSAAGFAGTVTNAGAAVLAQGEHAVPSAYRYDIQ